MRLSLNSRAGVYVPPTSLFPRHFHNIGIRIEVSQIQSLHPFIYLFKLNLHQHYFTYLKDEVLVGKNHPVILSVNAPKEVRGFLTSAENYETKAESLDRGYRRCLSRTSWAGTTLSLRHHLLGNMGFLYSTQNTFNKSLIVRRYPSVLFKYHRKYFLH